MEGTLDAAGITRGRDDVNDDRLFIRDDRALVVVGDAAGPTYGGYYAPVGVDAGIAALARSLAPDAHTHVLCGEACDRAAFEAANSAMHALDLAYHERFAREVAAPPSDRLAASLRASQHVARERCGLALDSFAHFYASVTSLRFVGEHAIVAQVGSCRAYRFRAGTLDLLVPDHTLATQLRLAGDLEGAELARVEHAGITTQLLGANAKLTAELRREPALPGDRYVVCSDGLWARVDDAAIARACAAPADAATIAASLASAAGDADDVTVAVVSVS